LETGDIDPSQRLLHIRSENTKNRLARVVPYSKKTAALYNAYLAHRRQISRNRGPLFLSESHRNYGQPISIWTWSKVIQHISHTAGLEAFSTHTLRHLCLTDLARANWDIHDIATFAGHRSLESTLRYIHLSGRDLAIKLEQSMQSIHEQRNTLLAEVLK
jgi:integrase